MLTLWVTFLPCFTFVFLGAPLVERLQGNRKLSGALSAVTAAVVGVAAPLAVWFALHVLFRDGAGARPHDVLRCARVSSIDLWALAIVAGISLFRFELGLMPTLSIRPAASIARSDEGSLTSKQGRGAAVDAMGPSGNALARRPGGALDGDAITSFPS